MIASTPIGGHWPPISTVGDKALWKKVQKIAKKNNASDTMNNATPIFKPLCTAKVWFPRYVASLITSLNQNDIDDTKAIKAKYNTKFALKKPCIVNTPVVVTVNNEMQVSIGQGEGETRWNGCAWKLLRITFVMISFCLFFSFWLVLYSVYQLYRLSLKKR